MAASTATNIGLQYAWALGEDGWNTGMDSNLLKLDSLVQPNVIDSTLATPPGSPTIGDKYIVATGGTGSWNALDAKVVIWSGSAWVSYTAKEGWMVYDQTNNYYLMYNGSAWVQDPLGDRAYAESLVTGLWDDRGNFDASVNAYPSSGGSGTAGAIMKGDIWTISVAGTLPTAQDVEVGDTVRALQDTPGNTQANWAIAQNNIGYVPESSANKSTDGTMASNSDTLYPSQKATKTYVDTATASVTQTGTIATPLFINRLDHFIGDEDSGCFTETSFTKSNTLSSTEAGTITGASAWRGIAKHSVSTSSGQRRFNFGGGYTDGIAGSAGANIGWVSGDKFQFLWRGAISFVPDGSNQFSLAFGFSTLSAVDGHSPTTTAGYSHAFIWADDSSGFWKCYSRSAASATEEATTTAVAVAALTEITMHVVVATSGNVEFYINNTLVATHSGAGRIQAGDKLIPVLTWANKASIAATRYLYSDCVGYLLTFSSQAAGLNWR